MEVVVIRKNGGFYYVLDNDAIVVSYLTNYKIINGRCGFPLNSLSKVTNLLEDNTINYVVRENMKDIDNRNYKKMNRYSVVLEKGKKKFDIDYRINDMVEKIKLLDYDKLSDLLDMIEEYCNEQ